jgi:UDP-glucose:(heptosyl)LPS alpha-1,3-glucosyltransferase
VRACYFAADFLVHPTFYDPCSLVVLEALSCGLPVVTTRYNGAADLLHPPYDGFVLDDPHDIPTLAEHLDLMCDPYRRSGMAKMTRHTAAAWTFEEHYRGLLAVFEEAARLRQAA